VRNRRKGKHTPPYETLSDIAIGSLGVFIVLVVVIIILSSGSQSSSTFEKIKSANSEYQKSLSKTKNEINEYQNSNFLANEIKRLEKEFISSEKKLQKREKELESKLKDVKNKEKELEQLNSIVSLIKKDKKLRNQLEDDIRALNRDLIYLNNRKTGEFYDLSGQPYITFGTYSEMKTIRSPSTGETSFEYQENVLLGYDGVFSVNDFLIITNAINAPRDAEGFSTFTFKISRTNSKYKQDQSLDRSVNTVYDKLWTEGGWTIAKQRGRK